MCDQKSHVFQVKSQSVIPELLREWIHICKYQKKDVLPSHTTDHTQDFQAHLPTRSYLHTPLPSHAHVTPLSVVSREKDSVDE